ncbi:hypothetical protein CLV35_3728 [Motilibacter peucedani]|uniref:Secreted protein n=1 Tax=Motilibacter peucedani TaxID=598650 RepID=A0A420XKJ2_9ACTN|nr:hypothetical protein [Motilibacter peucedani]RKS68599.1 hypothetical protein CLV35_3728 [Motilibacter peucedani]
MRRLVAALTCAVTAVASAVVLAAPASAAGHQTYTAYSDGSPDGTNRSLAVFYSYGDLLVGCDMSKDGHHSVVVYYARGMSGSRAVHNHNGAGGQCTRTRLDLPEGTDLVFQSCIGEGSRIYACGDTVAATA